MIRVIKKNSQYSWLFLTETTSKKCLEVVLRMVSLNNVDLGKRGKG